MNKLLTDFALARAPSKPVVNLKWRSGPYILLRNVLPDHLKHEMYRIYSGGCHIGLLSPEGFQNTRK